MKVLLITQHYFPQFGGIQTFLIRVVNCFKLEECIIIAPKENKSSISPPTHHKIIRKPFYTIVGFLFSILSLFFIVQKNKIERILCGHLRQGIEAFFLFKMTGVPYYIFTYAKEIKVFKKSVLKRYILKKVLQNAAGIIAISHYTKDCVLEFAQAKIGDEIESKISLLNPIPDPPLHVQEHQVVKLKSLYNLHNKKVIFSVSRLEERKGIDMVIKALPDVWQKIPNAVFVIASSGPYEHTLRELALESLQKAQIPKEELEERILFVGKISDDERAAWFTECSVYATPSRIINDEDVEGYGIVFLEANLYGKPVIGGKSGGIPDAVVDGETGILVNPVDVEEIASALIKLLSDEEYAKQMGEKGRKRVEEEFNQEVFCEKLHGILNRNYQSSITN